MTPKQIRVGKVIYYLDVSSVRDRYTTNSSESGFWDVHTLQQLLDMGGVIVEEEETEKKEVTAWIVKDDGMYQCFSDGTWKKSNIKLGCHISKPEAEEIKNKDTNPRKIVLPLTIAYKAVSGSFKATDEMVGWMNEINNAVNQHQAIIKRLERE